MKRIRARVTMVAAGIAVLAGCGMRDGQPDGSGTIECTQVQVSPQVAGRIVELPGQEGDAVAQGALVAKLDPVDYELKRDEARAALAQAQAQLDLMLAGARDEDIQRAREQVREAGAAAKAAEADRVRIRQVFDKKSATQKQMDDAQAAADRTAAALAAAQQNLDKLVRGNRQEEIRAAQAAADLARARLAQAEKAVADCVIIAPIAGVITTKVREAGEYVGPGAALLTLSRLDEVWLSVYIPETRLGRVKLGQPARVRIDGDARVFEGKVTFVSPEAEFTPKNVQTPDERAKLVYRVKITLPNPDGVFKPGMPADGYLEK
ncbi:MAG TPA: efflux RND transporter periplasmic adaptor subunit [Kiritimatiellia bacterium]|nr:efflux RND transporter periplasmic adaptor subunit [Kiritimatiellia bacterium]HRZ12322.1 efflux RND transporter periplasmic adaptor subunit [Kiritimatiellia bacterium]HSA17920.1 efflux RND transporter periplasmic adaptor subunit [Kiritimatiellia bacterium]